MLSIVCCCCGSKPNSTGDEDEDGNNPNNNNNNKNVASKKLPEPPTMMTTLSNSATLINNSNHHHYHNVGMNSIQLESQSKEHSESCPLKSNTLNATTANNCANHLSSREQKRKAKRKFHKLRLSSLKKDKHPNCTKPTQKCACTVKQVNKVNLTTSTTTLGTPVITTTTNIPNSAVGEGGEVGHLSKNGNSPHIASHNETNTSSLESIISSSINSAGSNKASGGEGITAEAYHQQPGSSECEHTLDSHHTNNHSLLQQQTLSSPAITITTTATLSNCCINNNNNAKSTFV